jgi:prepilin-type N-terminal cleavage/methylation domain-containing protein
LRERAGVRGLPATRNLHSKGFTLIEIVMSIVLVGILAGVASMIIMQGARSYSAGQSRGEAHQQARFAMDRMAREIRLIRSRTIADIPVMNPTDLRFTDINGTDVRFQLDGSNNIQRSQNGGVTWNVLASGISALTINYFQQDGVTVAIATNLWFIDITLTDTQGSESLTLRTRVHPRNF